MSSSSDLFKLVGRILIENADAISAIDDTIDKANELKSKLEGTEQQSESTGKSFGSKGGWNAASVFLGNMATKAAELGTAVVKSVGKTGFAYNSMMEGYTTAFSVLIGDEEKAVQLLDDLWVMAAETPMEMTGLAKNAQDLLNYGIAVEKVIPMLNMLGDASLGNQKKMDGIVYAFGQVQAYGALRGQESMQFVENGFPILEMLEKTMNATKDQLLDMREKGNITFDDVLKAFEYATTDDRYAGAMDKYTKTFDGQKAKLNDAFAQTIGNLTLAFFELSKTDVIPKINESLEKFGQWVTDNQETLGKMAEAVGGLVTGGFDMVIETFTWMVDNGDATKNAIMGIATALTIGAIAAHPYAAAIMAVAAGLAWLTSEEGKRKMNSNHLFDGHDQEALDALQEWVEAKRALKEADDTYQMNVSAEEYDALVDAADAAAQKVNALDGELMGLYEAWRTNQENGLEYLDVPLQVSEDSEANMQAEIDSMTMEGVVKMLADTSGLQAAVDAVGLTGQVAVPSGSVPSVKWNADGAVFSKPTIFGTRMGLQGVGEAGAEAIAPIGVLQSYVSDAVASQNSGMVSVLQSILSTLNQINTNTASGHNVVLESGALVGQLAPALDTQLGTISNRKGRRN